MPPEVEGQLAADHRQTMDALDTLVLFAAAGQDLEKLHATVDYLRLLDGEKHIIFLTEEGLHGVGRAEYGETLARLAADARVTISTIHTAGLPLTWTNVGSSLAPRFVTEGPTWSQRWAYADSRSIAQRTGGLVAVFDYADRALDRVERSTRFTYLLGYYPKGWNPDNKPRRVEVKVTRNGASVLHRHEYYARKDPPSYDHRAVLTEARIRGARDYRREVSDIPLTISASSKPQKDGLYAVHVGLSIDAGKVHFTQRDGRHLASIEAALFVAHRSGRQVGHMRKRIDLQLTPASYEALKKDGIAFSAVVNAAERPQYLKAVVYDYTLDRVGSALVVVR